MTSVGTRPEPRAAWTPAASGTAQKALYAAGLLSSIVYIGFDLTAAALYPGYSLANQAISELSAIGAPTAAFWAWMGPAYAVLFVAFAIGVLRAGRGNRALRRTGWILLAFVAWGMLWPFFPMHQRGSDPNTTDLGHLVLGGGSSVIILAFVISGAFAFGRRFRAWSFATALVYFATAVGTFLYVNAVRTGAPTPGLGAVERVMIYSYLLWVAVLAIGLLRANAAGRMAATER